MDRYIVVNGLPPSREIKVVDTLTFDCVGDQWIECVTTNKRTADRIARLLNADEQERKQ